MKDNVYGPVSDGIKQYPFFSSLTNNVSLCKKK